MKVFGVLLLAVFPVFAQEDFHLELTAAAWRTSVTGTLQAAGLPVDLHSDLNLSDRTTFFGRLVFKPGRRHRLVLEGAPYSFEGLNTISRTINFAGRTFDVRETVASTAELNYVYGAYQFDVLTGRRGHLGVQAGGAYLDATGTLNGQASGLSGTRNQTIGLPLAGAEFRVWPVRLVAISGGVKGMALGACRK